MIKEIKWVNQLNVSVDKATQFFNLTLMQKKKDKRKTKQ